ncbi:hypothetical protein KI387_013465, partial [Taxus chinensis]
MASVNIPPLPPRSSTPISSTNFRKHLAVTLCVGVGVGLGVGLSKQRSLLAKNLWEKTRRARSSTYIWGSVASISMAAEVSHSDNNMAVEPNTGVSFPSSLDENKKLAGVGVRKKNIFGFTSINVYAFGLYADKLSLQEKLLDKYRKQSETELKENKEFYEDVIGNDLGLTVRLEIVYSRLSIGSVRSAFEESIGNRLWKFSGTENKELLQRFTSQFKDDYKLPRGTKIDISRLPGHILQTKIDDKEIGSIQSKLLCQSLFDLYIGEDPLDKQAKEKIGLGLVSLLI